MHISTGIVLTLASNARASPHTHYSMKQTPKQRECSLDSGGQIVTHISTGAALLSIAPCIQRGAGSTLQDGQTHRFQWTMVALPQEPAAHISTSAN